MTTATAEIKGIVEYRLGDGPLCSVPHGQVEIETGANDVTISWSNDETRQAVAITAGEFSRYVADKAIVMQ